MTGKFLRKTTAFLLALTAVTASFAACGEKDESSVSSSKAETTTVSETVSTSESTTETTTTTEEATEAETTTEALEIPSNSDVLDLIISEFGIISLDSSKDNVAVAKEWSIIAENAEIDAEAEATSEFVISAAMCATGFVTPDASLDDILKCAVEKEVIKTADISEVDAGKYYDIIQAAKHSWAHQSFENKTDITLQEGVLDFSNELSAGDYTINGDSIELPAEYAEKLEAGSVFILPEDSAAGTGGAYKAESITILGDGKLVVKSSKADNN